MIQEQFRKNTFLTQFRLIFYPTTAHFECILALSIGPNAPRRAQNGLETLGPN